MTPKELNDLMQQSAQDAIKIANEEFKIELDFSADSASKVDQIIDLYLQTYQQQVFEDKAVFTICNVYGAYLGESFLKLCGGNWYYDDSNQDAPAIYLMLGEKSYAFAGICYERLMQRSSISIAEYFNQALGQHIN